MSDSTDWFSGARPDAPVAEYIASAPRRMANPPRSQKVRERLLEDLVEYGVTLEPPAWPPPAPSGLQKWGRKSRPISHNSWRPAGRRPPDTPQGRLTTRPHSALAVGPPPPRAVFSPVELVDDAADKSSQSKGFPTALWRPERSQTKVVETRRPEAHADPELRNARWALKSKAALHSAAVGGARRCPAPSTASPTFSSGAVTAAGVCNVAWTSEESELLNGHNSFIRAASPSGLRKRSSASKTRDKQNDDDRPHQQRYELDTSSDALRAVADKLNVKEHPRGRRRALEADRSTLRYTVTDDVEHILTQFARRYTLCIEAMTTESQNRFTELHLEGTVGQSDEETYLP